MIHFLFQTDQASNCQDAKESTVNELEFEIWMASPIFFSYEACLKENKKSFGKYILHIHRLLHKKTNNCPHFFFDINY